jgi:hypothetical protein
MSSTQGRWVFFLSGVVCAIWLLAVHAFLDDLLHRWPADEVVTEAEPCERPSAQQSWKLRSHPGVPPVEATTVPLPDGGWGLRLCGIHDHDVLFDKGLRHGDLLVEVDGWRPSSPRAALASYGRILADEVEEVGVTRGDRTMTVTTRSSRACRSPLDEGSSPTR